MSSSALPNHSINRTCPAAGRVIDGTTAGGKEQMVGLLSAHLSGKLVAIDGTATCSVWGDTETVQFFHAVD